MPDYLLACTCGQKTVVSTAQAGQTVRCLCGAALQVPTLRGLAQLEPAVAAAGEKRQGRAARVWEDRHRAAFLLVLASCACLAVAGYLWLSMPPRPVPPDPRAITKSAEELTATEAFQVYNEMSQGLTNPAVDVNERPRRLMAWGIAFAAGVAVVLAGAAGLVLWRRPPRRA
jgi:hypothetical protein